MMSPLSSVFCSTTSRKICEWWSRWCNGDGDVMVVWWWCDDGGDGDGEGDGDVDDGGVDDGDGSWQWSSSPVYFFVEIIVNAIIGRLFSWVEGINPWPSIPTIWNSPLGIDTRRPNGKRQQSIWVVDDDKKTQRIEDGTPQSGWLSWPKDLKRLKKRNNKPAIRN